MMMSIVQYNDWLEEEVNSCREDIKCFFQAQFTYNSMKFVLVIYFKCQQLLTF